MRTLLLVPILLAFTVMGIGTHAAIFDCATASTHKHDALVDGEITISTLVGQCGVNGIVKIGNASSARNLFADGACPLKSDLGTKQYVRFDQTCGQILILSKVPITAPLPTPCPPSPSPSQTPAQVTLTVTAAPAGKASVSWQLTAAPGNQDWIGMYKTSEPNGSRNFVPDKWVYVTTQTGSFITDAPSNGSYEWRYLLANGYQNLARSATFVIGPTPTPAPTATPTPVPTPTPSPSSVTYDFARFDILGKTVIEQDDILAAAGDQGYGKCFSIVLARYFYCFRVQGSTTKFEWKRFPWINGQSQRDALSTQIGQEGFSNVFPWAGYLRASKPRP